jgi:hypothetical protein
MDEIGRSTGVTGRNNNSHSHQQWYGSYGFDGAAATDSGISLDTSVDTPGETTFETVDDHSTIRTRKDHGLKPLSALSEQNVHRYSFNQNPMVSAPPLQNSKNKNTKSETRSEVAKVNLGGVQSTNQREPVPDISEAALNEMTIASDSHHRLMKVSTPTAAHTATTPRSQALDLKHNDNSFQVIASLIVDKFDAHLRLKALSITMTLDDRQYLDRVVQDKKRFVDALRYRLETCPEHSMKTIHAVTRKCRSLGLDREGSQNILNAAIGSTVRLSASVSTGG